jgi:hypothetical protein
MTAGAFLRWLPSRLWCSVVGHRFTEAKVASRYGLVDGYTCERCGESTPGPLFVWQRFDEEGSD